VVWLISGSDYKIHMIREDKLSHVYSESSIEKYFPELHDLQAIALWINIYYYDNHKRFVLWMKIVSILYLNKIFYI